MNVCNVEALLDNIAAKVPQGENTYMGEDGLLHCNNCRGAKEVIVEAFGVQKKVRCLCKCETEKREREVEERKQRERLERIKRYRDMGFADRDMMQNTFEVDDGARPEMTRAMRSYVENFGEFRKTGKGLLLYGSVGTGKSFFAACVVNALIEKGYPCLMTNFSRLVNTINADFGQRQMHLDALAQFSLIAIDDLGVERDTDYMNENVTTIIDSLYRAGTPLIVTSNFTPKQLTADVDIRRKRVYDRLLERCFPIEVNGDSRRKEKGRNDYMNMKEMLGL